MALPVGQHRHQNVGAAQQWRVGGGDAAQGDVVATAGAAMGAVHVERLRRQSDQTGLFVEGFQLLLLLGEAGRRRHVDLDDAGVGRDAHRRDSRIRRRPVALGDDRAVGLGRGLLDAANQVDEVLQLLGGRQVDVEQSVPDLGHHRRRRHCVGVLDDRIVGIGIDGQAPPRRQWVGLVGRWRRLPADRVQGQPQSGGRVTLQQHDAAAAQSPVGAGPPGVVVTTVQRQHVGGGFGDRLVEPGHQRGPGVRGVGLQIVFGEQPVRPPAGSPRPRAGPARPRRPAAPPTPAARGCRRWRRAPAVRRRGLPRSSGDRSATGRRAMRRRATAVRHPCASTVQSASAATVLPDTTCPGCDGPGPAVPTPASAVPRAPTPAGACAARRRRWPTPGRPGCRSK